MTMRTDETTNRMFTTHPLRARRRPGPPGQDARPRAEQDLEDAAKILEMIESGQLDKGRPIETPLGIPCDSTGRPLRRLTAKDEQDLAFRIQTFGDVDARNTMVLANLGLVHLVANQMRRPHLRYDDLVQEGTLGLLRATETFEPDRGVRFSTYCVYWIRAKIQRYLQRLDRDDVPSVAGANMVEDDDGRRKRPRARKLSMSTPVGDEGEDRTIGDLLKAAEADPQVMTLKSEIDRTVARVLHEIADELKDPRLATIIDRRLLAAEPETLAMLGERLNPSREGARLLENKVLKVAKERLKSLRG